MDAPPIPPRVPRASPEVRRTVVAVLALAGAGLATATVLARPAPSAAPITVHVARFASDPDSFGGPVASSGDDTGPGCAESEVAKLPDEHR
jgi:hypothetical protein